MKFATINPVNNQLTKRFAQHTWRQAEQILRKSEYGLAINKTSALTVRSKRMQTIADLLEANKNQYAALITLEMGKPMREAVAEIEKCVITCRYFAENAKHFLKDNIIRTENAMSMVNHVPIGTILAIMPWNFPFWQIFRFAAPALMAGNAIILKHAPNVPQCALAIEELFQLAHFPEGIFQNIFFDENKIKWLIDEPRIHALTFTGSAATGAKVAELAGKNVKKAVLELGGSDAFIVLEDANIKEAAKVAVQSRMINCGQSCIAAKRFIVANSIAREFTMLVADHIRALHIGDPTDPTTDIGPMARPDLVLNLERQMRDSIRLGAQIITGGSRPIIGVGNYFYPTLLINCRKGMPVFDEEVFGPIAPIATIENINEAIQLANDTPYGLGASIWSTDIEKAMRVARQIQVGTTAINTLVQSDPRLPFGGVKKSGYGRELSEYGIREFTNAKTIVVK